MRAPFEHDADFDPFLSFELTQRDRRLISPVPLFPRLYPQLVISLSLYLSLTHLVSHSNKHSFVLFLFHRFRFSSLDPCLSSYNTLVCEARFSFYLLGVLMG